MTETQHIEFKSTWRDEYLKWVCGFANAEGGVLCIGKDDAGNVVGAADAERLLVEIPNKVRDVLGIMVDVNLHHTDGGDFLEIVVGAHSYPVNYKGQYHYRSGSTKQELKGVALDNFLLRKRGLRWDGVPVPRVTVSDLKADTFDYFRKRALKSQRIEEESLSDPNGLLLDKLRLTENGMLKRAALLLFHPDPEQFVTGAFIKIGHFLSDDDLRFQDEVHGNLFEQVEKTMDLLFTKYLKAEISYEGLTRVERFDYPKEVIREALLNAVAHKDYSGGIPIQIKVYPDRLIFWNIGQMPDNWTMEQLMGEHPSLPYNPDIANAFFRSGHIESWGRGLSKMARGCMNAGLQAPTYAYGMGGFKVEFFNGKQIADKAENLTETAELNSFLTRIRETMGETAEMVVACMAKNPDVTTGEIALSISKGKTIVNNTIRALKDNDLIDRVGSRKSGQWVIHAHTPPPDANPEPSQDVENQ